MKLRIVIGLLVVSLLFNVAGLIFFFSFLHVQKSYKNTRRERDIMAHNLSVIRGRGVVDEVLHGERVAKRTFVSHADGREDTYALMPPYYQLPARDFTLVVYLHGMGSSYLEPFIFPEGEAIADLIVRSRPRVVFLSVSYKGEASWGNDAAMSDITQNIREVCQQFPIKRIVLIGTSMGGCMSLTYATAAPPDIREKISGVVSVESAGDLTAIFREAGHPGVKPAMIAALGASPDQAPDLYRSKSFLANIDGLPPGVRVAVVSARQDEIVPPHFQKDIVEALKIRQVPVRLIEIDAGHGCPPAKVYLEGFEFVLPKATG